jgi:hypothetical protein
MDASISFSHLFTQEVTTSQLITPPSKARYALITGCGGGGGGGAGGAIIVGLVTYSSGGMGGCGAPVITEFLKIEPGQSLDCVIGVGGNGGVGNQGSGSAGSPSIVTHGSKIIRFPGGSRGNGGVAEGRSSIGFINNPSGATYVIAGFDAANLISEGLSCTVGGGSILSRYVTSNGQNSKYANGGMVGSGSGPGSGGGASLGDGGNGGTNGNGSPGSFGGGGGGGRGVINIYSSGGKGGDGKLIIEWFM